MPRIRTTRPDTMRHCPTCSLKGAVTSGAHRQKGYVRYLKCTNGHAWRTIESVITEPVDKVKKLTLSQSAVIAARRGCEVPPHLEDDWKLLRRKGISTKEIAKMLGLPWSYPSIMTRPRKVVSV